MFFSLSPLTPVILLPIHKASTQRAYLYVIRETELPHHSGCYLLMCGRRGAKHDPFSGGLNTEELLSFGSPHDPHLKVGCFSRALGTGLILLVMNLVLLAQDFSGLGRQLLYECCYMFCFNSAIKTFFVICYCKLFCFVGSNKKKSGIM